VSLPGVRWARPAAIVLGLALMLGYAAWQWQEPHGAHEFAYAPFSVEPMLYSAMRGFTYEQLWGHLRRVALLGPGLALFAWALSGWLRLSPPRDLTRVCWLVSCVSLLVTAVLMLGVLRGRAISDDELTYAMQGEFMSEGRVNGLDLGLTPAEPFSVPTLGGYTGKYLPGEGFMQIPGILLGVPALSHLALLAVTLWAFHRCLVYSSGPRLAALGTIALACSPMLMFTSATGLSHASALMWVVLMGLGLERARAGMPVSGSLLAGSSFAAGLLTRPQSLAPIGAVLGVLLLVELFRKRQWLALVVLVVTTSVGCGALLGYDWLLSGDPWRLPWFLECGAEHFGFGRVWVTQSYEHTPWKALQNLGSVALRLNSWWLGLPASLGVLVAWVALGRRTAGAGCWFWAGAAVLVFQFFYYSPGASDVGSIYHYELLLPGAVVAAVVADAMLERLGTAAPTILLCALVLGSGSWLVEQGLRLHRLVSFIHRDSDQVLARVSAPALLIHEVAPDESLVRGWLFNKFPWRFRSQRDEVVTFPRITPDIVERANRIYPGRSCWYFRYLPGTDRPELLRCEAARELLARSVVSTEGGRSFWYPPTAYKLTSYDPFAFGRASRRRAADGTPLATCCHVRWLLGLGASVSSEARSNCIETGEPSRWPADKRER
jgi:hypothetical protein